MIKGGVHIENLEKYTEDVNIIDVFKMFNQEMDMVFTHTNGVRRCGDESVYKQIEVAKIIRISKFKNCYHLHKNELNKYTLCYPVVIKDNDSYEIKGYIFINNIEKNVEINLLLTICEFMSLTFKYLNLISYIEEGGISKYNFSIFETLTTRELEIMECIIKGYPDIKITEELFISKSTLRGHLRNIFDKLGVSNRTELSNYYYNNLIKSIKNKIQYYISNIN